MPIFYVSPWEDKTFLAELGKGFVGRKFSLDDETFALAPQAHPSNASRSSRVSVRRSESSPARIESASARFFS